MGLFGLFKKKEEVLAPLEDPGVSSSVNELPDFKTGEEAGIPEVEVNPIHEQYRASASNNFSQQSSGMDLKDIQLIISKLDLINARLENLNERLLSLERNIVNQEKRRW